MYNKNCSKTQTTNFYLHDAWKARYCQPKPPRKEIKYPLYLSGFCQPCCLDSARQRSPKALPRQRSPSPNLPKISYLGKPTQHTYPISQRFAPRNPRQIACKNQAKQGNRPPAPKVTQNVSKKSIPDHTLMKSLLSGLSVFDSKTQINPKPRPNNVQKLKSMGNINCSGREDFGIKVHAGNPKSNVDFSEMSLKQSRNEQSKYFKLNERELPCRPNDRFPKYQIFETDDDLYKSETSCPECLKDRTKCFFSNKNRSDEKFETAEGAVKPEASHECPNRFSEYKSSDQSPEKPQKNRSTLVAQRKKFFESHKNRLESENFKARIKPNDQTFEMDCVEKQIQKDCSRSKEITEIYRNFRSIHSNSTLSKGSSNFPPVNACPKRTPPRNADLFNPDYNFHNVSNSNQCCSGKSLIESIRTKIFQANNGDYDYGTDYWEYGKTVKPPKFPKETRRAMSIIVSNRTSNVSCRLCQERLRAKPVVSIETQTSPFVSTQKIFNCCATHKKLPCTKNLLCNKGFHTGKCEDSVREKLIALCTENCVCRNNMRMIRYENLVWPGQKRRVEASEKLCREDSPEDAFPSLINPDFKVSDENIPDTAASSALNFKVLPIFSSSTMNGLNGHSNGDLNGCGDIITQNQQRGCWTIGLINSKYRYLTAETFGFKINANGASLKKKQIWTLEPDNSSGNDSLIYLKSHLDKYLAVDSFGNVTCESEEKEPGSKFQISVAEDGTGRWAFRNVVRGYFLGSSSDKLTCTGKVPGDAELWHIHLAARPQVNLRSVGRKRFAHLSENLDEIHVDANIPWGEDTLFTLEFHADESGKYALHTCNNKYLSNGGKLVDTCTKDCLFSAEYHSGQLALRDRNGAYLSPIGSKAVLKTRSNTVTKDELFSLEDSLPQASFVAALNSRYVSVKQGVDVTANQDEISDHETFQLEFDWSTKRWYIRTMQDKYWTLETGGGIQASGDKRSSNALFDLAWQTDGSLAFRANNGRYVITKRSGHLYATSDAIDDNCKYFFYLINRPILVLKCEQGFVGYKSASSPKLECNKATYECIQVERAEKGVIYFKGQSGKYWHFDSEGVTADSDTPEGFYLELREPTRLCIKTAAGNYLTAGKNGAFRIGDSSIENATQWEY